METRFLSGQSLCRGAGSVWGRGPGGVADVWPLRPSTEWAFVALCICGVPSPRCFLQVSRLEAQLLLERYPECGNLLLRPGGDGKDSVSVTTRQILNGCASQALGAWPPVGMDLVCGP